MSIINTIGYNSDRKLQIKFVHPKLNENYSANNHASKNLSI